MVLRNTFKKKLLLFLAFGLNYWDQELSYTSLKYPYYHHGKKKKSTIYSTVSKLVSVGDIEKIVRNGEVFIRLTSGGNQRIKQEIPLFKYSNKPWDGYWRLVIFDIPEKNKTLRNLLRRKLVFLGLGQWQRSIYITPFNLEDEINDFLKAQNLFKYCFCIRGKRLSWGDDQEIAKIAFKLDILNKEYDVFINRDIEKARFLLRERKIKAKHIQDLVDKYFDLILKDPGLPKELLPKVWWANQAKKEFKDFLILLKNKRLL